MRYSLLLVGGLSSSLLAFPLHAQTTPDSTTARAAQPALAPVSTREDSIRAIHHLYKARRRTGTWFIAGGATALTTIGMLYAATAAFSSVVSAGYSLTNQPAPTEDNTGFIAAAGIVGAVTVVPAVGLKSRFSRQKEKALIQDYEQGQPLPAELRSALQDKFFRRTR
ncbi:hypothetical protein MTX78_15050 [Hymenobacter tibetensis]|uniref:Uncharacterized protein n=1 Tax=Hymenobacter tibetensis TaxID=497967 RepID=A0ABY4CTJ9_9BACT|nr:hypothetical protein [Hymenobacter tibetensis]UOG73441.1 hypothetical protein MTX78_15050 [Hymenobacter tibetensis]